ncbi:MAG TPA: anti-sigma factor [Ideonella sp.]|uniref:anti-sigma factor n=1 Tax=Ideonella sp. TaxID=1929293 RepID=UPI002CAEFA93|nr:anti-sigma factor [Ideonella sp.]HSI50321.1 anti-sigma factor [Ideonella sp.]
MDYSRPERAERLASEYVLGTLRGAARSRFEALLPAHPTLRRAVAGWEGRLLPLTASVPPVAPSASVWAGIEARLFRSAAAGAPQAWWQRLLVWQLGSGAAAFAALVLAVMLARPVPPQAPVLVLLSPNPAAQADAALLSRAKFVASISADGRALVLRPLEPLSVAAGRALELWAVPAKGAPRSLGLISASGGSQVRRTKLLQDTAAFAISLEPSGGSPTGAPTGPVISLGALSS